MSPRFTIFPARGFVPREFYVLARIWLAGIGVFALLRLVLLLRNVDLAGDTSLGVLVQSFVVGVRFDMVVVSELLILLLAWTLIPRWAWQYRPRILRAMPWVLSLAMAPLVLVGLAEAEFYREFHERYNQLAIQYLNEDPATVLNMVWHGYPVLRYLLAWGAIIAVTRWLLGRIFGRDPAPVSYRPGRHWRRTVPAGLAALVMLVVGARGGLQDIPIRWGDAYFSHSTFANHLAQNGIYMLGIATLERGREQKMSRYWLRRLPKAEAARAVRRLVVQDGDRLLAPGTYPLYRHPGANGRRLEFPRKPRNVVVILMESFSAEFVGALGADFNTTPVFDRLAGQGLLFDHFFSQGTHTHQGLFATMISFPNLPGFEYLMQNSHGQQPFRSLPAIFQGAGFGTAYVYNGSYTWDNQQGFFRNQGMQHFIGRDDYVHPHFMDPTWGVSDEDMFLRGVEEIRKLASRGPAFVLLQTISNHAPFRLPPPAPFGDLGGDGSMVPRLNGIRYSDWALGSFFETARREPWFEQTLFVILGDHGFGYGAPKAPLDLSLHHVPLLLYYPPYRQWAGRRVHTVASQVDVLPTVAGLAGINADHQGWGRDLFRLAADAPGWAVVKPSGNRQVAGWVHGDRLLVIRPGMEPELYRYRLNPFNVQRLAAGRRTLDRESRPLFAYIETGLDALLHKHAGIYPAPAPAAAAGSSRRPRPAPHT